MRVEPKVRGFICTTAHAEGCRENVKRQIEFVTNSGRVEGAKKVLVVGASTGYGLASRISSAFGCGAATIGVIFDKPAANGRTASAGWYNTAAFEEFALADGLYAKTVNGDGFSKEVKDEVIALIKRDLGKIDLLVYSLAAPRRAMPDGTVYSSVLKTTGGEYTNKTIDLKNSAVSDITIQQATDEEIEATVKVMGGEDWKAWIAALRDADALEADALTVAYSYVGPELTHPVYLNGSIGRAKRHLYDTAKEITREFPGMRGYVSVNKALVTQSSAAIPIVPLYISLLYRVMKEKGVHEGCIEQMYRMYRDRLFQSAVPVDEEGRIRLDDLEMAPDIQNAVSALWAEVSTENVSEKADIEGYWQDFYEMFGFRVPGVDYSKDIEIERDIPSLLG